MLRRWHADGLAHLTNHLALGGLISEVEAESDDAN
jgi:hypothetical protein